MVTITEARIDYALKASLDEISDFSSYELELGDVENYVITSRLGRGKYSEVFEGLHGKRKIVIKSLKPVREYKIKREIYILRYLNQKNIVKLIDLIFDPPSSVYSLIFNYIEHDESGSIMMNFSLDDIRHYSRQILEALSYCHSQGVMHRDIKPQNMIINEKEKSLYIIDWGLAEFYVPKKSYSVKVASRHYKSPELLVSYPYYDFSLDLWSFGCVLAEMVFKKRPIFKGDNNTEQMFKIMKLLGYEDFFEYIKKYDIPFQNFDYSIYRDKRPCFKELITDEEYQDVMDLLDKVLVYDHYKRFTADECLSHDFYK